MVLNSSYAIIFFDFRNNYVGYQNQKVQNSALRNSSGDALLIITRKDMVFT